MSELSTFRDWHTSFMEGSETHNTDNKRKRSKTSVACAACKSRKTKCSGGPPPCESCDRLHTVCVFHPGSDMRRRDSKDHFKAYKALLDAFVTSTRSGDVELSTSLYKAIQLTDASGKLAEIAQSYAQAVHTVTEGSLDLQQNEFQYKLGKARIKLSASSTVPGNTDADSLLQIFSESILPSSPVSGSDGSAAGLVNSFPSHNSGFSADHTSDTEVTPTSDRGCQTDLSHGVSHPKTHMLNHGTAQLPVDDQPIADFRKLQQFWHTLGDIPGLYRVTNIGLPNDAYDPVQLRANDPLSKTILDFRDGARRSIQSGTDINYILGSAAPSLETYFGHDNTASTYSTWSWACQFASTFPDLPLTLHLGTIYMAGIQMRFYIYPCEATFNDLPPVLRPLRKQYTIAHAAGLDICHVPVLKDYLFSNWDKYDTLLMKLVANQECNWPYSNSACFQPERNELETMTMSQAFLEHIRDLNNYTLGPNILAQVPQLIGDPVSD